MKVLVAEDEAISRLLLVKVLSRWGFEVIVAADGDDAWRTLEAEEAPPIAILDWMMPGMDGLQICRAVRHLNRKPRQYIILLTAKVNPDDLIEGFAAGADEYVTKPFNEQELRARVQVGCRLIELQAALMQRVKELEEALSRVTQLEGLLPICSYCKKVRDDGNYWQKVEEYIEQRSGARFTHGICPECYDTVVKAELDAFNQAHQRPA
jgi:DNA-binding response OmpR family regulator